MELRTSRRSAPMSFVLVSLVVLACDRAGSKRAALGANDPAAPAVVLGQKVVLPSDTVKLVAPHTRVVTLDAARLRMASDFAVLGAAIAFGDRRTIGSTYAPDAQLTTPDSVFKGAAAISGMLAQLGRDKSLKEFTRRSTFTRVIDSTVVDSGLYTIVTKRTGADSILESGRYATTWRIRSTPNNWMITQDRLYRQFARRGK